MQIALSFKCSCFQRLPQHMGFLPTSSHIAGRVLCARHPQSVKTLCLLLTVPLFARNLQAVHGIAYFSLSLPESCVEHKHGYQTGPPPMAAGRQTSGLAGTGAEEEDEHPNA